ncbi:MAG TPA: oligosaccharide flippase family protein [Candidatus Paceibacterota bacterium]
MELGNKIKYFYRNGFIRGVATLQAWSFSGTIIQSVVSIVIARLLQPELFGVYALAIGMASMTSLILGMGIQEAVSSMLGRAYAQKNGAEVEKILGFMLKITFFAAMVVILVSAFLPSIAGKLYGNSLIGVYAAIVVIASVFSSFLFTVAYSTFQVTGRVKLLGILILSDQSVRYTLSLIFVLTGFGVLGAVSGQLAGAVVMFLLSGVLFGNIAKSESVFPGLRRLVKIAKQADIKKYFGFTFWVAFDRNMGNVYMALPVILTGIFVSASDVSFFKLAFGYMSLVLSLLGPISVLLNVEFPKIQVTNKAQLYRNFKRISLYSLLLSVVLSVGAVVVSPIAFRVLYGESYLPSIKYVFGLVVYGSLFGIGVGLGPMWRAINKVKVSILINSLILAGGIPLGLWLIKNYGLWGSVIMVTVWFTVSHLASFIYLIHKLK